MERGIKKVNLLIGTAQNSFEEGNFKNALDNFSKAIKISASKNADNAFLPLLAKACNGMGHTLRARREFVKSKEFQDRALRLYKKLVKKDPKLNLELVTSLHYMSDILADLKQLDQALEVSREELKLARQIYSKNKKRISSVIYGLNGLAYRLADKRKFKEALLLFNESLEIQQNSLKNAKEMKKSYPNLSWTFHGIGTTLLKMGDIEGALPNLKIALEMRMKIAKKNKRFISAVKNTLYKLGEANYRQAKEYWIETLKIVSSKEYKNQILASTILHEKNELRKKLKL